MAGGRVFYLLLLADLEILFGRHRERLLQIQPLVERVDRDGISEVILALTPSVEGDTTSLYLARLLKPFTQVSRIAYGLPVGSELEYADEVTLARALEGRRRME